MRTLCGWILSFGCAALLLGPSPRRAHAETFSMSAGKQTTHGPVCYHWGTANGAVGAYKSADPGCSNKQYVMALYWRTWQGAGATRSVTVRGKIPPTNAAMSCTLAVYNSAGTLVSSDTESFTATNPASYTSITLNVTQITSTSTSFIVCNSLSPTNAPMYLLKVDYSP